MDSDNPSVPPFAAPPRIEGDVVGEIAGHPMGDVMQEPRVQCGVLVTGVSIPRTVMGRQALPRPPATDSPAASSSPRGWEQLGQGHHARRPVVRAEGPSRTVPRPCRQLRNGQSIPLDSSSVRLRVRSARSWFKEYDALHERHAYFAGMSGGHAGRRGTAVDEALALPGQIRNHRGHDSGIRSPCRFMRCFISLNFYYDGVP